MTVCACVCPRDAEELRTVANSNGDGSVEVDDKETVLPRGCGESCVVTFRDLPSVRGNFRSLALDNPFVRLVPLRAALTTPSLPVRSRTHDVLT